MTNQKMTDPKTLLLVFSDDWGRHPSSCQHLIKRLLDRYDVVWVNTIGTRALRLNWVTIRRAFEKTVSWIIASTEKESILDVSNHRNPKVLNPKMLPSFGGKTRRRINKSLLVKQIIPELEKHDGPVIGITTVPYVSDLIGELPVDRWVYYCVDDWSCWPEMDAKPLRDMESELIEKCDAIICVSRALQSRIAQQTGRASMLLQHGFDEQFLRRPRSKRLLKQYPGRKILYWGLIDQRLDPEIVTACAKAFPKDSFVFVGPLANPSPELFLPKNVFSHGVVEYNQLPALAMESSVLIMPYADTEVTRQIQPLKMLEYLAVEKPIIARNLPSTSEWADCLDVADSPEEFVTLLKQRLAKGSTSAQRRARKRVEEHSWENKAGEFEKMFLGDVS
ncbi:MAG: hypothetical protein IJH67_03315 [Thermoguttaceae bacterium]|nr:hypothetical protein [Thermoguttaceae bacterium]